MSFARGQSRSLHTLFKTVAAVDGARPEKLSKPNTYEGQPQVRCIARHRGFVTAPRLLFDDAGSEIGGNLVPLSDGKWLVVYTKSDSDVISDYMRTGRNLPKWLVYL